MYSSNCNTVFYVVQTMCQIDEELSLFVNIQPLLFDVLPPHPQEAITMTMAFDFFGNDLTLQQLVAGVIPPTSLGNACIESHQVFCLCSPHFGGDHHLQH